MYNPERIAQLLMLYTLGKLTPAEQTELNVWRKESPRNEELFQYETNPQNIALTFNSIAEKKEPILRKIKEAYPKPWADKIKTLLPRIYFPRWLEVAIYILIFSIGGYFIYDKWDKSRIKPGSYQANILSFDGIDRALEDGARGYELGRAGTKIEKDEFGNMVFAVKTDKAAAKDKYNLIHTPRGGFYDIRLPDGTLVLLNALSSISYPANYTRDTVTIELKGEAYFEVNRATSHPFIVQVKPDPNALRMFKNNTDSTPHLFEAEVSRGRFNINAYEDEPFITTTMIEGDAKTRFGTEQYFPETKLSAGDLAMIIDQSTCITASADTAEAIAWKNGRIYFKETAIRIVMNAVSRWYNVPLVFHDSIPERPFNLDVSRDASIHEVIKSLIPQGLYCYIADGRLHIKNRY